MREEPTPQEVFDMFMMELHRSHEGKFTITMKTEFIRIFLDDYKQLKHSNTKLTQDNWRLQMKANLIDQIKNLIDYQK